MCAKRNARNGHSPFLVNRQDLISHILSELGESSSDAQNTKDRDSDTPNSSRNFSHVIESPVNYVQPPWEKKKIRGKDKTRLQERCKSFCIPKVDNVVHSMNAYVSHFSIQRCITSLVSSRISARLKSLCLIYPIPLFENWLNVTSWTMMHLKSCVNTFLQPRESTLFRFES
jgi:hypothetical protein